jgi:hypothetical protein
MEIGTTETTEKCVAEDSDATMPLKKVDWKSVLLVAIASIRNSLPD